jgi:hypothetical protein
MKTGKINLKALIAVFFVAGLMADLMPYPGLEPGAVMRSFNWVASSLQTQPIQPAEQATNRIALLKKYESGR